MLAESAPWTFCQTNTVMLTCSHNHVPGILLWQCSCHRNEKQNSESFFNYDANLTSVITMELKFIFFSLRCWFLCMTSLVVTSSKTSVKFWGTSFKFWLRPCNTPWICRLHKRDYKLIFMRELRIISYLNIYQISNKYRSLPFKICHNTLNKTYWIIWWRVSQVRKNFAYET